MDSINALTDRLRTWFDRSPKAQRAYARLSADLDVVAERVDSATSGLRKRVGPYIDPSPTPVPHDEPGELPPNAESGRSDGDHGATTPPRP